jgi:hypothetical protein
MTNIFVHSQELVQLSSTGPGVVSTTQYIGPTMFTRNTQLSAIYDKVRLIKLTYAIVPVQALGSPGLYYAYFDYKGDAVVATASAASLMQGAKSSQAWLAMTMDWKMQDAMDRNFVPSTQNRFRSTAAGEYHSFCIYGYGFTGGTLYFALKASAVFEYTGVTG